MVRLPCIASLPHKLLAFATKGAFVNISKFGFIERTIFNIICSVEKKQFILRKLWSFVAVVLVVILYVV